MCSETNMASHVFSLKLLALELDSVEIFLGSAEFAVKVIFAV